MTSPKKILLLTIILGSIFAPCVLKVSAYVSTPIRSGQIYSITNQLAASYAAMTSYDAGGGGNDPFFFPGVESHSDDSPPLGKYYLWSLQISVSGTKPNGSPIIGLEFTNLAALDSPHDSGYDWDNVLAVLCDAAMQQLLPAGASALLKHGQPVPGTLIGGDAGSAWVRWEWDGWPSDLTANKGLQLRFSLHCDPSLPGLYTLNLHYRVEICTQPPGCDGYYPWGSQDIYETIEYYFGSPKLTVSTSSHGTTSPASGTYTYDYGATVLVTAIPDSGYGFEYSLLDGTMTRDNPINVTMDRDHTLKAYFSKPICAMKTETNGYFYIPNVATSLLEIEMLFNNQGLAGDQTDGTIANYPDGTVDMCDISFIIDKFMSSENQSGWDYMADVVPDRVVDMTDVSLAISNFCNSGTYIKDFTGFIIVFNTGEQLPCYYGFVSIPPSATSFTVRRYDGPTIGAMIIFW
jgi:hypothetical protein